jgi:hypothetical protein
MTLFVGTEKENGLLVPDPKKISTDDEHGSNFENHHQNIPSCFIERIFKKTAEKAAAEKAAAEKAAAEKAAAEKAAAEKAAAEKAAAEKAAAEKAAAEKAAAEKAAAEKDQDLRNFDELRAKYKKLLKTLELADKKDNSTGADVDGGNGETGDAAADTDVAAEKMAEEERIPAQKIAAAENEVLTSVNKSLLFTEKASEEERTAANTKYKQRYVKILKKKRKVKEQLKEVKRQCKEQLGMANDQLKEVKRQCKEQNGMANEDNLSTRAWFFRQKRKSQELITDLSAKNMKLEKQLEKNQASDQRNVQPQVQHSASSFIPLSQDSTPSPPFGITEESQPILPSHHDFNMDLSEVDDDTVRRVLDGGKQFHNQTQEVVKQDIEQSRIQLQTHFEALQTHLEARQTKFQKVIRYYVQKQTATNEALLRSKEDLIRSKDLRLQEKEREIARLTARLAEFEENDDDDE